MISVVGSCLQQTIYYQHFRDSALKHNALLFSLQAAIFKFLPLKSFLAWISLLRVHSIIDFCSVLYLKVHLSHFQEIKG